MVNNEVLDISAEPDKSSSLSWSSLRKSKYAELNQDEMRYDDMVNNTNTWGEAIESIKLTYPKPTGE